MPASTTKLRRSERLRQKATQKQRKSPPPQKLRRSERLRQKKRAARKPTEFPFKTTYNSRKKCYSVRSKKKNKKGKPNRIYAHCTTKTKAQRQMRLLAAVVYNPKFRVTRKKGIKVKI
jgi:hypothetical protein